MFCQKCGAEIPDGSVFCNVCGAKLHGDEESCINCGATGEKEKPIAEKAETIFSDSVPKAEKPSKGKGKFILITAVVVVILVVLISKMDGGKKCAASGCKNSVEYGNYCSLHVCHYGNCESEATYGNYCINHVCMYGNCTNPRSPGGVYCSYHENSIHNPYSDLSISSYVVNPYGSDRTKCSGTITNIGNTTYRFVQVKGAFKDSSGKVVDTDWTYAVGSEGLAPGESSTFEMWIDKKSGIYSCDVSIIDYST